MPEGDTIHHAAACLSRALVGKTVSRFATTVAGVAPAGVAGLRVERVEARGKWLSIHFERGRVLVTHMRMTGAWHVYSEGERWRRPAHLARLILSVGDSATGRVTAVCFQAPVVRLLAEADAAAHLAHLGPDVMTATFDAASAVARLRERRADASIGEALLDQGALAGIGNVYKSEVLFAERIDPFLPVSALDDATLARIVERAHSLMRRNAAGGPRTTTRDGWGPRHAVYRRRRLPCPRCGYPVERAYQGTPRRSTYYCPRCQRGGG